MLVQQTQDFFDSVYSISHSVKTVQTYKTGVNHFKKYLAVRHHFDEFEFVAQVRNEELDLYRELRNIVTYLDQKGISPKGIRSYMSGIKGYIRSLGIRIDSDDFKQFVRLPRVVRTKEIPITKEMIRRLMTVSSPKLQAVIVVLASSGLRLGEAVRLRLSDVDFTSNPTRISVRGNASKGRVARETYITSEATQILKDYLKRYFDWFEGATPELLHDPYIFWRISKRKKAKKEPKFNPENAKFNLQISLRNHITKIPELNIKNENGQQAIHFHSFRKFARTTIGNVCGRDYGSLILGHHEYMDEYFLLDEEKRRSMYLDAEPHLTIGNTKHIEKQFSNLSTRYTNLESRFNNLLKHLDKHSLPLPENL